MAKEEYYVIDKDDNVNYIIMASNKKNGNLKYKLFRSNSDMWTSSVRGEHLLTIVQNPDLKVNIKKSNMKGKKMEYHELMELKVLLCFIGKHDQEEDFKVVEVV